FPGDRYAGHNNEQGFYGIFMLHAFNSWVCNVTIVDADRGVEVEGVNNTISGVILKTKLRTPIYTDNVYATGHYGFSTGGPHSQDNLFANATIDTVFVHNMTVASFTNGNVYSKIISQAPHFDHHAGAPYENLYTQITLTNTASNFFKSGGNRADEPNGTRTTVWNVVYSGSLSSGKSQDDLPQANIIGVNGFTAAKASNTPNWWVEPWVGSDTNPRNLHDAQFQRRKGSSFPSEPPPAAGSLSSDPPDSSQSVSRS